MYNQWETLPEGFDYSFSPSGHAIAFRPMEPFNIRTIHIEFLDRREPFVRKMPLHVQPLVWVSTSLLVYQVFGLSPGEKSALFTLSLTSGQTRFVTEVDDRFHASWNGIPGHISVLTGSEGKNGLYDIDVHTGEWKRLTVYDEALKHLMVYPQFGHSWSPQKKQVALIAWPYDFLGKGIKFDEDNSQWSPILDKPLIQSSVVIRKDGSKTTQHELTQNSKRRKPPRLFLLNSAGKHKEVPATYWASNPIWSPDESMLCFKQYLRPQESLWIMMGSSLECRLVGTTTAHAVAVMNPSGILFYRMDSRMEPSTVSLWQKLLLKQGTALPMHYGGWTDEPKFVK